MLKIKSPKMIIEYDFFARILAEYVIELNKIDSNVEVRSDLELASEYFFHADTDLYFLMDDETIIGFAIIGRDMNCHENVDIYINEFYIKPEYRRQGCATYFAKELVKNVDSVCFFVIKKNKVAKMFWKKIFSDWIDEKDEIKDMSHTPDWLDWYVYRKENVA